MLPFTVDGLCYFKSPLEVLCCSRLSFSALRSLPSFRSRTSFHYTLPLQSAERMTAQTAVIEADVSPPSRIGFCYEWNTKVCAAARIAPRPFPYPKNFVRQGPFIFPLRGIRTHTFPSRSARFSRARAHAASCSRWRKLIGVHGVTGSFRSSHGTP